MDRIVTTERPIEKRGRQAIPVASRLRRSKNFEKEDRNLDGYIESNKLLNGTDKRVLKKLLKLRGRDDSSEVKTTHSGLAKLLALDRRTVASSLRHLVEREFLIYEKDAFDEGCNFQKKFYRFPDTFPGFDNGEVFMRNGDKQRAKLRKEAREQKARMERQPRTRMMSADGEKTASNDEEITCTKHARLLDRAFNKVVRKNTSYSCSPSFVASSSPRLAAPSAEDATGNEWGSESRLKSQPSLDAAGQEESQRLPSIVSLQPQFRSLILSVLSQIRQREHIRKIVGFIDYLASNHPNITCLEERFQFAKDLEQAFKEWFLTDRYDVRYSARDNSDEPRKHKRGHNQILKRIYAFFRSFIKEYIPFESVKPATVHDDGDDVPFCKLNDDSILGMHPELPTILETILETSKAPNLTPGLSDYIERQVGDNGTIQGFCGRQEIADVLLEKLFEFHLYESHKRTALSRLYRFLDGFLTTFSGSFIAADLGHIRYDILGEQTNELMREFPWLDPEYEMTARQQQRAKKAIKHLKVKLMSVRSLNHRLQQSSDRRMRELAA